MMQTSVAVLVGLALSAPAVAEPLMEGRVRLASGQSVAAAQVLLFDLMNLQRGPVARATTDAAGYFALASLGGPALPQGFALGQNYPNPFNPSTIIPYQLPTAAQVRLEVFNVLGQRVATLVNEERPAGFHTAAWDATNAAGQAVAAGVYMYRLTAGGQQHTRRMVLIDGQAGVAAGIAPAAMRSTAAVDRKYGLAVVGAGLATYVDADFRAGLAPVDIVVETLDRVPRAKGLTGGILGDVNADGQVDLADALAVALYIIDPSITPPNNGDISLGDVNADGQLTTADVLLIAAYSANPSDPSLPAGIGQAVGGGNLVAGALRRLTDDPAADWSPSFSPDGHHIAFMSKRDGNFEIYVMGSDGSNPTRLTDDPADDFSPSFSPDGHHIAFMSKRDGNFEIYVMGFDGSNPTRLTDDPADDFSPSFSPDGRHIVFESARDGNQEIYVMGSDGSNPTRLTHDLADDWSPSFSPDGRHIAFVSERDGNSEIYMMDSDGSNPLRLTHHTAWDFPPSFSPDGRHIVFASYRDGNFEIYVMGFDGSNPTRLTHDPAGDYDPSFSPDGRHIVFWSERDGEIYLMEFREEGGEIYSTPGLDVADYVTWHLPDGALARLGKGTVEAVAFSPDGQVLAVAGSIGIWLYDAATSRELALLTGHTGRIESVSFSPDGSMLASGGSDVILWDVASGSQLATLYGSGPVSFSPDGSMLASGGRGSGVILWDVASGSQLTTLQGHEAWVESVSFSSDGSMLASGSGDNTIILWDVWSDSQLATLQGHTDRVESVSFSPDGSMLASGSRDGTVILWDIWSDSQLATLEGHRWWVESVSFSPDGSMLASGGRGNDNDVILWDVSSGSQLATLQGHTWGFESVSFSPDGSMLASGSSDGTVLLWRLASIASRQ